VSLVKDLQSYLKNRQLGCYVISYDPLIITSYWHDFLQNRASLFKILPAGVPVWIIFQIGYYKSEEASLEISQIIAGINQEQPNLHFWFLNNSLEEDERFRQLGLNSRFINQNAFLDENRYHVLTSNYRYDAIYLARFTPVKRHYLAEKIHKLLLIGSYKASEADYYNESREILKHAAYKEKVWGTQVSNYMNMAQVGLCLSDLEGAMFVSTEYLLSGLPVVSTPSLGGRDIYYEEDYARIVEPDAEAVAEAVYELIEQNPDRHLIRSRTIEIVEQHRAKFIDLVQEIYDYTKTTRHFNEEWRSIFIHKMGLRSRIPFSRFRSHILRENQSLKPPK
jgi:glycosyltransferase involved in cell wall biosynthesis